MSVKKTSRRFSMDHVACNDTRRQCQLRLCVTQGVLELTILTLESYFENYFQQSGQFNENVEAGHNLQRICFAERNKSDSILTSFRLETSNRTS